MTEFFTNHISKAPSLSLSGYLALILIFFALMYLSCCFYQKKWYRSLFWWLQFFQIVSLYSWYIAVSWPLSESLPFYHCRLAMLFILWAKPGPLKRYFAYLGLFGSLVAFIYPVFDPFAFPHLTFFTFVVGHYALAVNCLLYLLSDSQMEVLGRKEVVRYTVTMNAFLLFVNALLGGNYGFLSHTPLVNSRNIPLNFLLVTVIFCFAILSGQSMVAYLKKRDWSIVQD